jgi:succinoglycan biosynthesis protein ExoV
LHRFKWYDWAEALDIKLRPQYLAPSSLHEGLIARMRRSRAKTLFGGVRRIGAEKLLNIAFKGPAVNSLRKAMQSEPALSAEISFNRALDKLETAAFNIQRDYPR